MKSLSRRSATPLVATIVAVFLFVLTLILIVVTRAGATDGTQSQAGRILTIHDRGTQSLVMTEAMTVGDALKEAGIILDDNDAVEPAATEELVAAEYDINIYRARPVIVVDGPTRRKVITAYQTGTQIAKSAGITLFEEDRTTLAPTDDIVSEGAGLKLTIDRSVPFTFTLYGTTSPARTQGETVGQMLKEKGVLLSGEDRVVPDQATPLSAGMTVRVWREGKQTVTVEEPVAFATDQIQDGDQYVGYRAVKTPGQLGTKNVTYEVIVQDGKEVGRTAIATIVTKEPIKQIDIVGAKYRGAYTTPTENEVITWNFLIANGFSREQTAGIMGNLMQEHRFNTTGDGLAQWTGARKAALLSLPDPYNIYTQLNFLMSELNGGYRGVRDAIKSSSSVEDAVIIFQNKFEKCGVCAQANRIQYAYNIFASH